MSRYGRHHHNDDSGFGCVVILLFAVFAMPIVGLYMVFKGDEEQKVLGIILTIVGAILWIYLGLQ